MAQASRQTGKVKWFNQQKAFGFITPDAGGDDIFVHRTSIQFDGYGSLLEGSAVEFSVTSGRRPRAVDVTGPNGSVLAGDSGGGRRDRGGSYNGSLGWGKSEGRTYGGRSCYNCGKFGHIARDCQEEGRGSGDREYPNGDRRRRVEVSEINEDSSSCFTTEILIS